MSDQITQGHSSRKSGGGKEAERGAEEGEQFEGPRSPQGELQTMQEKGCRWREASEGPLQNSNHHHHRVPGVRALNGPSG